MGNQLYDENKRLTRENESLRDQLREKVNSEALPHMLEGCLFAFFQGRAAFDISAVTIGATPAWSIRFRTDPPPAAPRQPSDAS